MAVYKRILHFQLPIEIITFEIVNGLHVPRVRVDYHTLTTERTIEVSGDLVHYRSSSDGTPPQLEEETLRFKREGRFLVILTEGDDPKLEVLVESGIEHAFWRGERYQLIG